MTTLGRLNALMNPTFDLWDFSESISLALLPSHGYSATRWKAIKTGSCNGTIGKAAAPTGIDTPKWYRGKNMLEVNLTGFSSGANVQIRQTIEGGLRYARGLVVMSGVVYGPAGATFDIEVGGETRTITTKGEATPVSFNEPMVLSDQTVEDLDVYIFTRPSGIGKFSFAFVQIILGARSALPASYEFRQIAEERRLCARYAYPVGGGRYAANTATAMAIPVAFPSPMRVAPVFFGKTDPVIASQLRAGTSDTTTTTPTYSTANATTFGARLTVTGWSGLTVTDYVIVSENIGVFNADY